MLARQTLIKSKKPDLIAVADKPPRLGGTIKKVSVDELEHRLQVSFDDSISVDNSVRLKDFNLAAEFPNPGSALNNTITRYFNGNKNHLIICPMGDCGYGIFAARDICDRELITIYSGTIVRQSPDVQDSDESVKLGNTSLAYSCRNGRGLASLMQHLPGRPLGQTIEKHMEAARIMDRNLSASKLDAEVELELFFTKFDNQATRNSVQTANVSEIFVSYKSCPIVIFVANQDIKAGEQIGWNYGPGYWANRDTGPELFTDKGAVISRLKYQRTHGWLKFNDKFGLKDYLAPIIKYLARKIPVEGIDPFGDIQTVSFEKVVISLFKLNAIRLELQPMLPVLVNVVTDEKDFIKSYPLLTSEAQEFFSNLHEVTGKDVIRKLAFRPAWEISMSWLQLLLENKTSQSGFMQVLQALNTTTDELFNNQNVTPLAQAQSEDFKQQGRLVKF